MTITCTYRILLIRSEFAIPLAENSLILELKLMENYAFKASINMKTIFHSIVKKYQLPEETNMVETSAIACFINSVSRINYREYQ